MAMSGLTAYQRGNRITYTNAGSAIAAGDLVAIATGTSGFVGVAVTDIAATTGTGELAIGGGDERVFKIPKTSGEAWTQGQVLYTDGTNGTSTSSTTFTRIGRAAYAAASADVVGYVILNQP